MLIVLNILSSAGPFTQPLIDVKFLGAGFNPAAATPFPVPSCPWHDAHSVLKIVFP
jgi:hypothetical protein